MIVYKSSIQGVKIAQANVHVRYTNHTFNIHVPVTML